VKKIFTLVLGVVTSIGGFVEAGSISTAGLNFYSSGAIEEKWTKSDL
jgi:hypothetical protein